MMLNRKSLIVLILVAIALYCLCSGRTSNYDLEPARIGTGLGLHGGRGGPDGSGMRTISPGNGNGSQWSTLTGGSGANGGGMRTIDGNGNGIRGMDVDAPEHFARADLTGTSIDLNLGCAMNSGVGLASSLLPREVASQENFGEFAPNDVLRTQNLLDPRQQIGWPETIGGNLRNGNQSIRADPPNPKKAYEWNNSTIVPDLMQRSLC